MRDVKEIDQYRAKPTVWRILLAGLFLNALVVCSALLMNINTNRALVLATPVLLAEAIWWLVVMALTDGKVVSAFKRHLTHNIWPGHELVWMLDKNGDLDWRVERRDQRQSELNHIPGDFALHMKLGGWGGRRIAVWKNGYPANYPRIQKLYIGNIIRVGGIECSVETFLKIIRRVHPDLKNAAEVLLWRLEHAEEHIQVLQNKAQLYRGIANDLLSGLGHARQKIDTTSRLGNTKEGKVLWNFSSTNTSLTAKSCAMPASITSNPSARPLHMDGLFFFHGVNILMI